MLFTKNSKQLIGVDVSTTAIKMVEITRQYGLFHLKMGPIDRKSVV